MLLSWLLVVCWQPSISLILVVLLDLGFHLYTALSPWTSVSKPLLFIRCYGMNFVPHPRPNPYVEALTFGTSECDCVWS